LLGRSLLSRGDVRAAAPRVEQARDEALRLLAPGAAAALDARLLAADLYRDTSDPTALRRELAQLAPLLQQRAEPDPDRASRLWQAQAWLAGEEGRVADAHALAERALEAARAHLGDAHPTTAAAYVLQANAALDSEPPQQALHLARRAADRMRQVHAERPLHPHRIEMRSVLGLALAGAGQLQAGIEASEQAVRDASAVFGADSLMVAVYTGSLAMLQNRAGRIDAALAGCERALALYRQHLKPDARLFNSMLITCGYIHLQARHDHEALDELSAGAACFERMFGAAHPESRFARPQRAIAFARLGRFDEAHALLKEAFDDGTPLEPAPVRAWLALGEVQRLAGDAGAALAALHTGLQAIADGPRSAELRLRAAAEVGLTLLQMNRATQAQEVLQAVVDAYAAQGESIGPLQMEAQLALQQALRASNGPL
jgi:tetratricopeptide (TPR) repeat protein